MSGEAKLTAERPARRALIAAIAEEEACLARLEVDEAVTRTRLTGLRSGMRSLKKRSSSSMTRTRCNHSSGGTTSNEGPRRKERSGPCTGLSGRAGHAAGTRQRKLVRRLGIEPRTY